MVKLEKDVFPSVFGTDVYIGVYDKGTIVQDVIDRVLDGTLGTKNYTRGTVCIWDVGKHERHHFTYENGKTSDNYPNEIAGAVGHLPVKKLIYKENIFIQLCELELTVNSGKRRKHRGEGA